MYHVTGYGSELDGVVENLIADWSSLVEVGVDEGVIAHYLLVGMAERLDEMASMMSVV